MNCNCFRPFHATRALQELVCNLRSYKPPDVLFLLKGLLPARLKIVSLKPSLLLCEGAPGCCLSELQTSQSRLLWLSMRTTILGTQSLLQSLPNLFGSSLASCLSYSWKNGKLHQMAPVLTGLPVSNFSFQEWVPSSYPYTLQISFHMNAFNPLPIIFLPLKQTLSFFPWQKGCKVFLFLSYFGLYFDFHLALCYLLFCCCCYYYIIIIQYYDVML